MMMLVDLARERWRGDPDKDKQRDKALKRAVVVIILVCVVLTIGLLYRTHGVPY